MAEASSSITYSVVTLGCPKNLVDSERMLGCLDREGYQFVARPEEADLVVVNTCGFLRAAREESLAAIDEMLDLKRRGVVRRVIVTGCMAQREGEALLASRPGIDQVLGVFSGDRIGEAADRALRGAGVGRAVFLPAPARPVADTGRRRLTARHVAYLKIAEGCSRRCTFCSIPSIRGRLASKSVDQILAEAEELAAGGARELVLVAQDLTAYGTDAGGRPALVSLLVRLEEVSGIEWIRLMYLYPKHVTGELTDLVASTRKILPYLDLPLQHIHDGLLRRMGRGVTRRQTERLLDRLRARIPDLVLRTTLIVGFPGETEEAFEELLAFVRARRFERLGAFAYSPEPGTPAAALDGQLPEEVKQDRRDRLMRAQQEVAFGWAESRVGQTIEVIIDRAVPGEATAFVGRSYADAPEIDPVVYVTGEGLRAGQIVPCQIVAARHYDGIAVAAGTPH